MTNHTEVRTDIPTEVNGREVLAFTDKYPAGNGSRRMGIGICKWDSHDPFVVWNLIQDEEGEWFAEAGNYCRTLPDATRHYVRRGGVA